MCPAGAWAWTWSGAAWRRCADPSRSPAGRAQGLTVTLRLPLTLAIIDGLLVRVGQAHFVLPLANSLECVELTRQDIEHAHGKHMANVRGEMIPYIRLSEYFQIETARPEREQIMVVETEHGHYGFVVDQVLGDHQTVIKNLGRLYRNVQVVSGATILGNGTVALILDPHRLVQNVVQSVSPKNRPGSPAHAGATQSETASNDSNLVNHSKRKTESMHAKQTEEKQPRTPAMAIQPFWTMACAKRRGRRGEVRRQRRRAARVSQEILRLVEASRQGRLEERGKARPVSRYASRDGAGHQRNAGCDPAAHRRRQPNSGPDFRRQDRRADRANLQGRSRKDEAGGQ